MLTPHDIAELRLSADKAALLGNHQLYQRLHSLIDAAESLSEVEELQVSLSQETEQREHAEGVAYQAARDLKSLIDDEEMSDKVRERLEEIASDLDLT